MPTRLVDRVFSATPHEVKDWRGVVISLLGDMPVHDALRGPDGSTSVVCSDNGLICQSGRFRTACRDYPLRQEFVTPYTPEQNGIAERLFPRLKEECRLAIQFPQLH